jgi:hypothetical protein
MTTDEPARLTPEELAAESGSELPDKEVVSLLDLNANLDLALDAAAPIDLAIGANANVAAPIEASVGANVLSTGSTAGAEAVQVGEIHQGITGDATATSAQHSSIVQGADTTQPVAPDSPRTLEVGQSGSEQVMWLSDSPALPTASHPALGLVLRPEHGDGPT